MIKKMLSVVFTLLSLFIGLISVPFFPSNGFADSLVNGLVAHYPFDGDMKDASGNNHYGNPFDTGFGTDRNSVNSYAISFNGQNNEARVSPHKSFNSESFTISLWVHRQGEGYSENGGLVGFLQKGYAQYRLVYDPLSQRVQFYLYTEANGVGASAIESSSPLNINEWTHIIAVYENHYNGTIRLYINGQKEAEKSNVGLPYTNEDYLFLGRVYLGGVQNSFEGLMDELRFYNRVLTEEEILKLHARESGLVGFYPFNGNANDASERGNHGTAQGASPTTDRFGEANSAFDFDGIDDIIELGVHDDFALTSWTLSGWLKVSEHLPTTYILGKTEDFQFHFNYLLSLSVGTPGVLGAQYETCFDEVGHRLNSDPILPNKWTFFTVTRGHASGRHSLYVDGDLKDSGIWNNTPCANDEGFVIGRLLNADFFKGQLDDIRIHKRVLSSQEIQLLHGRERGLVLYLPFNGNANDTSGNQLNPQVNGATLTKDIYGQSNKAYLFDGNDHLEVNNAYQLQKSENFTISFWTKGNGVFSIYHDSNRYMVVEPGYFRFFGDSNNQQKLFVDVRTAIHDDEWHHTLVVKEGKTAKVYVDSILRGEQTNEMFPAGNDVFTMGTLRWGYNPIGTGSFVTGTMDEFRFYNRPFTADEVKALYYQESGLIGHFSFDGVIEDTVGNLLVREVSEAHLSKDRYQTDNRAIAFDGVNDHVEIYSYPKLDGNEFSVSFWVKREGTIVTQLSHPAVLLQKGERYAIRYHSERGTVLFYMKNDKGQWSFVESRQPLVPQEWTHVVVSFTNEEEGTLQLFLNAQKEDEKNFVGNRKSNTDNLFLGGGYLGGINYRFNGGLDEIRFYDRGLSETEVQNIFSTESGLVAYYPLNGNINDESGNGSNGTIDGASFTTDRHGNEARALSFDGVNDNIELPNNEFFDFKEAMSLSLWVQPTYKQTNDSNSPEAWMYPIRKAVQEQDGDSAWAVAFDNRNKRYYLVLNTENDRVSTNRPFAEIPEDHFSHLVITYDGEKFFQFLNGETKETRLATGVINNPQDAVIVSQAYDYRYYQGKTDDLRFYNRALSTLDIQRLYRTEAQSYLIPLKNIKQLSAGESHTCALSTEGKIYCWGNNENGQLGNNSEVTTYLPQQVNSINNAIQISVGAEHSCAVLEDSTLRCWGKNSSGQLGNETKEKSPIPVSVLGITTAVQVSAGHNSTCAVLKNGSIQCWGNGTEGQLGNGATDTSDTPVTVLNISSATQVSVGSKLVCAVLGNETIQCWGTGSHGKLGNGGESDSITPVQVNDIDNASLISTKVNHSCALLTNKTVKCWGHGLNWKLGNNNTNDQSSPVLANRINNAIDLSVGGNHSCALLDDNTLKCWGEGGEGQLGIDDTPIQSQPTEVLNIDNALKIASGYQHTCAILNSGTVKCWGNGQSGQLGNPSTSTMLPLHVSTSLPPLVHINAPPEGNRVLEGGFFTFSASVQGGEGTLTYLWNFDDLANNSSEINPGPIAASIAGTYTIAVTVEDENGAIASDTLIVTVEADTTPTVEMSSPSTDQTITVNQSLNFASAGTGGNGSLSYSWNFDGASESSSLAIPGAITFSNVGTYAISITVEDEDGDQASAIRTVIVEADSEPIVTITNPQSASDLAIGKPHTFQVDVQGGNRDLTYEWVFSDSVSPGGDTVETETIMTDVPFLNKTFEKLKAYFLDVTVADSDGDEDSERINFEIVPDQKPEVELSLDSKKIIIPIGNEVHLSSAGTGGNGSLTYQWNFSDGRDAIVQEDPEAVLFNTPGINHVTVTVTDTDGDMASETLTVFVFPEKDENSDLEQDDGDPANTTPSPINDEAKFGAIKPDDDQDYFSFTVDQPQKVSIAFFNPTQDADYLLELLKSDNRQLTSGSAENGQNLLLEDIPLCPGTYILHIWPGPTKSSADYSLLIEKGAPLVSCHDQVNDSPRSALPLEVGEPLQGGFIHDTETDYFKISLDAPTQLNLSISTLQNAGTYDLSLFSSGILADFSTIVDFNQGLPTGFSGDWFPVETESNNTVMQSTNPALVCSNVENIVSFEQSIPASLEGNWIRSQNSLTESGNWALQNAKIGHSEQSVISIEATTGTEISFDYRVSSEALDYLIFYVDGNEEARWSGETGWETYTQSNLTPGLHQFRWVYQKDSSVSKFMDAAWIDQIKLGSIESCHYPASVFDANVTVEGNVVFSYRKQGDNQNKPLRFYKDNQLEATFCENESCENWNIFETPVNRGFHNFRWEVPGSDDATKFEIDNFKKLIDPNLLFNRSFDLASQERSGKNEFSIPLAMQPGDYFLRLQSTNGDIRHLYEIALNQATHNRELEPNNTFIYPNTLTSNNAVYGQFSTPFDIDVYGFAITEEKNFVIQLTPDSDALEFDAQLYYGDQVTKLRNANWSVYNGETVSEIINLKKGNYYLRLSVPSNRNYQEASGYTLTVTSPIEPLKKLVSLTIQARQEPLVGQSTLLTATGYFLDGSTEDVTNSVFWLLSNDQIATFSETIPNRLEVTQEGSLTVKASYLGILGSISFQIGQGTTSQTYGNLVMVAGGGLRTSNNLKDATQFLSNLTYQRFLGRGFEDKDIYYFNPAKEHDIDGDGYFDTIVDSSQMTVEGLGAAITEWATNQNSTGPLYLNLIDHGGIEHFEIYPGVRISASQLDEFLDTFETKTEGRRTIVAFIEACKSGSLIEKIKGQNRLIITSSDSNDSYLSPSGDHSFSYPFWSQILLGATFEDAFNFAVNQLKDYGRPYNRQVPQINGPDELKKSRLAGDFVLAGPFPEILDHTQDLTINVADDFFLSLEVDHSETLKNVSAEITPPNYVPPLLTADFSAPVVNRPRVVLERVPTETSERAVYKGQYRFQWNGEHRVVFTIEDEHHNVASSPYVTITVSGGDPVNLWELVSFPIATTTSPESFFDAKAEASIHTIWSWENKAWKIWSPSETILTQYRQMAFDFEPLNTLAPNRGYWINSNAHIALPLHNENRDLPLLTKGWNLVSFGKNHEMSTIEYLNNNPRIHSIWTWGDDGQWHAHFRSAFVSPYPLLERIQAGVGYWVRYQ